MRLLKIYKESISETKAKYLISSITLNLFSGWIRVAAITTYYSLQGSLGLLAFYVMLRQMLSILLAPIFGSIVEKKNKRRTVLTTLKASAIINILIYILLSYEFTLQPGLLLLLAILSLVPITFCSIATMSIVPKLIDEKSRPGFNSIIGSISTLSLTLGPAFTALLLVWFELKFIFLIDSLLFLLSHYLFSQINFMEKNINSNSGIKHNSIFTKLESISNDLSDGVNYIRKDYNLISISLIGSSSMMGVGATWMLNPQFINHLKLEATYVGFFMSVIGIGSFLGMILGGAHSNKNQFKYCYLGVLSFAISTITWGNIPFSNIIVSLSLSCFFMGLFACIHESAYWSYLQKHVPEEYTSRVFTFIDSIALFGMFLGSSITALLLKKMAPHMVSMIIGSIMIIILSLSWILFYIGNKNVYRKEK